MHSIWLSLLILGASFIHQSPEKAELGRGHEFTKLYYHYPPDPVNVRTLNFYLPVTHLTLPCYIPIEIQAAYNSYSGESSIFGDKWTFNHNIRVEPAITHFEVREGDGFVNKYYREKNLEKAKEALIQQIVIAVKKQDAQADTTKDKSAYQELEKRLDNNQSFREEMAKKMIKLARPLRPDTYYSLSRGQSQLEFKSDKTFVRKFQNGTKETFDKEGRLVRSEDRNGNYISYVYQGDLLVRISDMCGRSVAFDYYKDAAKKDLVKTIKDSLGRSLSYTYDNGRRLTSYTNPEGVTTSYRYDKFGNMLEMKQSNAPEAKVNFKYNEKLELVEQTGPGTQTTKYNRSFVANNPNHSITEIKKYEGGTITGRETHEFKVGEYEVVTKYDKAGKEVSKTTRKFSEKTGYPVSILNAKGHGNLFAYDPSNGNLLARESVPSGSKQSFTYDSKCNQVAQVVATGPGQPKVTTSFDFDKNCNVIKAEELTGEATEKKKPKQTGLINISYTPQGKTKFLKDKVKKEELGFTYWKYGKPKSITLKDIGTLFVKYKADGEIEKVETFPHGEGKKRFKDQAKGQYQGVILREVRSSLDRMLRLLRPAGLNIGL